MNKRRLYAKTKTFAIFKRMFLSIVYKLDALGLGEGSDDQVSEILDRVKQAGIKKRDILTDDEFKAIAEPILANQAA